MEDSKSKKVVVTAQPAVAKAVANSANVTYTVGSLSNDAVELKSSFADSLGDVLSELVAIMSMKRGAQVDRALQVEASDAKEAAKLLLNVFRRGLEDGGIPRELEGAIDQFDREINAVRAKTVQVAPSAEQAARGRVG